MNIETIFGTFNSIQIEPYSDNETYSLSKIEDDKAGTYMILGFDAPIEGDREWRFWVECGDEDGYAETHATNIKPEEEKLIKQMYFDYKEKSKSLYRIEEKQGEVGMENELRVQGLFYMKMQEGETKEEAEARFLQTIYDAGLDCLNGSLQFETEYEASNPKKNVKTDTFENLKKTFMGKYLYSVCLSDLMDVDDIEKHYVTDIRRPCDLKNTPFLSYGELICYAENIDTELPFNNEYYFFSSEEKASEFIQRMLEKEQER